MAKPFSIQSPEEIAKEYGGNKQKIGEAMQMGIVDATAGVLAGMFIDRMRSAQMQEQAPQTTVAQQVMGGLPAVAPQVPAQVPPVAQPGAPAGLGAIAPQGEAQMPEAPMPDMAAPEEAPVGMAEGGAVNNDMFSAPYMGGVASLEVPDSMFDEPTNGGYAGGGLVAFGSGGGIDADRLRRAFLMQESSGDYGAVNKGSGALGAYQFMPATARALAKRLGMDYRPDLMTGKGGRTAEGKEYQERLMDAQMKDILAFGGGDLGKAAAYHFAGPDQSGWGAKTRQYKQDILQRYSGSKDTGEVPERNFETAQGRFGSLLDQMGVVDKLYAGLPEDTGSKEAIAYWEKQRSPEQQEKERKDAMWATLAQIGASMAGTSSPNFLQAVGQAIGAALPGAEASRKERKATEREAVTALSELYGMDRKEAKEKIRMALDLRNVELGSEEKQTDRAWRTQMAETERAAARDAATLAFERQMELAKLKDKGVDELAEQFYQMGKNEKIAQGLPVDEAALRATAMVKAMKVKAELSPQQGQTNLFDATGVRPAGAQGDNTLDFSQLK